MSAGDFEKLQAQINGPSVAFSERLQQAAKAYNDLQKSAVQAGAIKLTGCPDMDITNI